MKQFDNYNNGQQNSISHNCNIHYTIFSLGILLKSTSISINIIYIKKNKQTIEFKSGITVGTSYSDHTMGHACKILLKIKYC